MCMYIHVRIVCVWIYIHTYSAFLQYTYLYHQSKQLWVYWKNSFRSGSSVLIQSVHQMVPSEEENWSRLCCFFLFFFPSFHFSKRQSRQYVGVMAEEKTVYNTRGLPCLSQQRLNCRHLGSSWLKMTAGDKERSCRMFHDISVAMANIWTFIIT